MKVETTKIASGKWHVMLNGSKIPGIITGGNRRYLTENPEAADPPKLFRFVRDQVMEMARGHIRLFGAEGRA